MKKRIAIDMDGVIADLYPKWIEHYNCDYNDMLTLETIHGKTLLEVVKPECGNKLYDYLDIEHFFRDLPVIEDSQDVIYELSKHYDIFIATAAMSVPHSFSAKFEWLQEHFGFIPADNIVFCGDKSIIQADYLIDDHSRNFRGFSGQGILFTAFHNIHEKTKHPRVHSWKEIAEMLLK